MKFIKRIPIAESMISGTGAYQSDGYYTNSAGALVTVAPWVSGQSVSAGDIRYHDGKVWQALSTHAQNSEPDLSPTYWAFVAPTNRWAAFDDAVGSYVQSPGSLTFTLQPTQAGGIKYKFDAFGCLGMLGDSITVDVSRPGSSNLQPYGTRTLPAGEWRDVTYGNAFLAVGSGGGAYSTNGTTWAARTMPAGNWKSVSYGNGFWLAATDLQTDTGTLPTSATWTATAFGNGVFVAVNSNTLISATSADGKNWTQRTLPAYAAWGSVAFGNNLFVAVGVGNLAATSPDGITWTQRTMTASNNWSSITFGNGLFIALASNRAYCSTSTDGITWTDRVLPTADWRSVAFGNNLFVAVAANSNIAATSPDGITWTQRTLPRSDYWSSIAFGNGFFVAIALYGSAVTTTNGITWTTQGASYGSFSAITFGNGLFVAVSFQGGFAYAETSSDGVNWTLCVLPNSSFSSVAFGNGVFALLPLNGPISATITQPSITKSTDTVTWPTPYFLPGNISTARLAASATHHVLVSDGQISYSTNGTTFTSVAIIGNWREVSYVGDRFIALSEGSTLAYSTNATTWTTVNLGYSQKWTGAAFGAGQYIIVGEGYTGAASADGVSFTLTAPPYQSSESITFGNGLFVVTSTGKAWKSSDGFSWVSIEGELVGDTWIASAYANVAGTNTFVALAVDRAASAIQASSIYKTTVSLKKDDEPVIDFWTYCFAGFALKEDLIVTGLSSASYTDASITITITGATAKLGTFNFGQVQTLGTTEMGLKTGITNYSTYDVDQFGVTRIVPRSFAKRINANVMVDRQNYNSVFQALIDYKDTAVMVFPTENEDYSKATAYGHIREWSLSIDYPTYTILPIEVRGLT